MKKRKKFLRWGLLLLFIAAGAYWTAAMPAAVESFLPKVETVRLFEESYTPTASASGVVSRQDGNWLAVVAVRECDIGQVETGQQVTITGAAFPDRSYDAVVHVIADSARQQPTLTSSETVIDVTVLIEDGEGLRSGYTVDAEIKTGESSVVSMLPYSVICQDEQGEYVYVIEEGKACRRGIITGKELSSGSEILSGVTVYDSVIAQPHKVTGGVYVAEVKS